jgi:CheY-like chemotaxis protein
MKKIEAGPKPLATELPRSRILYVEDEAENWNVTRVRLGERYQMERASTDTEALQVLRANRQGYDAILMDLQLKGSQLDGMQLTQLLRGKLAPAFVPRWAIDTPVIKTPIIFVTAYGLRYGQDAMRDAGADMVIEKPINFSKLTLAIANATINLAMSSLRPR